MGQDSAAESGPATGRVRAEEVAAFLQAHPDFLAERPELADLLSPPAAARADGVIDLRSYLVHRLRGTVDGLRQQQRALLSATRANHNTQGRVHAAVLFLLDAGSFEQLVQTIATDLAVLLELDTVALVVESEEGVPPPTLSPGVQLVAPDYVEGLLHGQEQILESDIDGSREIFGPAAGLVRSQALIRLSISPDTPPCLLALGSREPDKFHAGMRTELMGFLARVLERCVRSWLHYHR